MICDIGSEEQKYRNGFTLCLQQHEKNASKAIVPCYRYFMHIGVSQMPDFAVIEQNVFVRCNAVISLEQLPRVDTLLLNFQYNFLVESVMSVTRTGSIH